jgi:hypothetical protein
LSVWTLNGNLTLSKVGEDWLDNQL